MDVDFDRPSALPRCVDNCTESKIEGQIINIDPRYPVPDNLAHEDMVFPWMAHVQKSFKLHEVINELPVSQRDIKGPIFVDIFKSLGGQHLLMDSWAILKKGWSLTSSKKLDIAENVFRNYTHESFGDSDTPDLDHVLFNFCLRLLASKKYPLFNNAAELLARAASTNEPEYRRFRTFFIDNQREKNLDEYFDVFNQYFKNYSEFAQTDTYAKNEVPLPSDAQVASTAFRDTKQFYGNAFEALTSGFTTLACINNILSGRQFDQFQSMDLNKYLTTNKAGRANPFSQEPKLFAFANCVNSTIRNASHHGAMTIDHARGVIRFRSGGTGAEQQMTYAEYLLKCNEIMLSLAALVALELLIAF